MKTYTRAAAYVLATRVKIASAIIIIIRNHLTLCIGTGLLHRNVNQIFV